jgi:holo-[acyl-carrier protein] synthase
LSIGFDLVEIEEIEEALRVHADRYLDRVFTVGELAHCRLANGEPDARALAVHFAAKEAAMKALRADFLPFDTIELLENGKLELHGQAALLALERGISDLQVSFTRARGHAGAVVIALAGSARP